MFEPDKWSVFAAAIVGAAAALMGLLFVAVSVRLDILTTRRAAITRAAQALLLLTIPFVAGVSVLVPGQPSRLLGLELLLTAGISGAALLLLDRRALAQPSQTDHLARTLHRVSPNLTTTVGLVLTGASLAIEWGGGLYWLVPTVLHLLPDNELIVEDDVVIGPGGMIHGCHIGAGSIIEPAAIVCDWAVVGRNCLVRAGSIVAQRSPVEDNVEIAGCLGEVVG